MARGVARAKLADRLHCAFCAGVLCPGVLYMAPAAFTQNPPPPPQQNSRGPQGGGPQRGQNDRGGPGGANRPPSQPSNRGGSGGGGPGGPGRQAGSGLVQNRVGPGGTNQPLRPGGPAGPPGIGSGPNRGGPVARPPAPGPRPAYQFRAQDRSRLIAQYRRSLPGVNRTRRPHFVGGSYLPRTVVPYFTPVPPGVIRSLPPVDQNNRADGPGAYAQLRWLRSGREKL